MTTLSPPNIFEGAVDLGPLGSLVGTSTRFSAPIQQLTNAQYNPYFYQFGITANDSTFGLKQYGATFQLYNFNRQLLATGGDISATLNSGTYFIKVTGATFGAEMALFAFGRELADPDGNLKDRAVDLGTWSSINVNQSNQQLGFVYDRVLHPNPGGFVETRNNLLIDDKVDWYKFTLTNTETIDFTASGKYGGFVLTGRLSGNLGTTITTTIASGDQITLQAGDYSLEVFGSTTSVIAGGNGIIEFDSDKEFVDSYSFALQRAVPTSPNDHGSSSLVNAGNKHGYQYVSFNGVAHTWDEARAMATAMGGYLVTITSQAENDLIKNSVLAGHLIPNLSGAFIGSTDAGHEGSWVWATGPEAGTAFSNGSASINGQYTNWTAGDPGGGTAENYGFIGADGKWLDVAAKRNPAWTTGFVVEYVVGPPPPPPGTTAFMIMRNNADYEIYNLGSNRVLAGYDFGQVGTDWKLIGGGKFDGSSGPDMMLRNVNTGGLEVYNVSNNNIVNAQYMGVVGLDWKTGGFGDFNGDGYTDMMLRNATTGGLEAYNIAHDAIVGAAFMGTVGLDWKVTGFGDFFSRGHDDMIMRNANNGGIYAYDISGNRINSATYMGVVGTDWQAMAFGDFSSRGTDDMIMRNVNTGGLEVYNIDHGHITGAAFLGTVGLDWQYAGVAPVGSASETDLVLRNVNTGQFEVYDVAHDRITGAALLGAVGTDWSVDAVAPSSTAFVGAAGGGGGASVAQLTQAMAGFGGGSGAADNLSTAPLGADTSQQSLLATPHA
jgi:Lectin C-type domain